MAECTKNEQESDKVREDWKFVAMVLDRLFLWIFSVAVVGQFKGWNKYQLLIQSVSVGTAGIILQAPSLYVLLRDHLATTRGPISYRIHVMACR